MKCNACDSEINVDPTIELCLKCLVREIYDLATRAIVKGRDVLTVDGRILS
ncbi:MAG: hypothetical protein ACE5OZ_07730 [Candidatus Heimdallarchaeota archaeon]